MTTAISVQGVGKRYVKYEDTPTLLTRALSIGRKTRRSALWALRGASFDVARGEALGVIGRNGSGKSTLLRMLAGVTAPTEGSVTVSGRVAPLISVGVGFHPELTGRENVYVNGTVLGMSRTEIDARFDEIVAFAGLEEFIDTPVKFYSSGMFVRLGFAVSVFAEPDVLLVDEVLAVGDVAFQLKCYERMREIQASGTTVVVVSHNLNAIRGMCPRTLVIHDGQIALDCSTPEAISGYHDLLAGSESTGIGEHRAFDAHGVVEEFVLLGSSGATTGHVHPDDELTLRWRVRFTRHVDAPLLGISVLSEGGVVVYTDTPSWSGEGRYEAGDRVTFTVRLKPVLAPGSYSVQLGLTSGTGTHLVPAPEPVLFYVEGRQTVGGVTDLRAEFDVATDTVAPTE